MRKHTFSLLALGILSVAVGLLYVWLQMQRPVNWLPEAKKSVVGIQSMHWPEESEEAIEKHGSGFVVSEDGLVATAAHSLGNQLASYSVTLKGSDPLPADKVFEDSERDIAFLRIVADDSRKFAPLKIAQTPTAEAGEEVFALYFDHEEKEVISSLGKLLESPESPDSNLLQSDATIPLGGSGGPLLNQKGQLIGLNVGIGKENAGVTLSVPWEGFDF